MSEINLHWRSVDAFDSWYERTKDIKGTRKTVIAYNKNETPADVQQYGGTAIIARGDIVHRIVQTGKDETNLGRWVWMAIQGKNNRLTMVISAYRPCHSHELGSVYEQHRRYFDTIQDSRDP